MDGQKFLEICIEKIVDIVNRYSVSNSVSAKDVLIVWMILHGSMMIV